MPASNATIGALRVSLGLDSAQFESGLKRAQGSLGGFAKSAAVIGAAVGTALVAAGAAVSVAIKGAVDRIDELNKVAQQIGVPVGELSKLSYAAGLADVSLDQLATGLKKFSVNIDAAAGGGGAGAAAFKRLGIDVRGANGELKPTSDLVAEVAGKFGAFQDGASKTALAVQLFGKSGADLIPLLNAGAEGLRQMTDEAVELGLVIDQKTAASADNFNDNLDRLKQVTDGITTRLAAGLLPAMEAVSNVLVSAAKDTRFMTAVSDTLVVTLKSLATAGVIVGAVFKATFNGIRAVVAAVLAVTRGDFAGAFAALKNQVIEDVNTIAGSARTIAKIWTATGSGVSGGAAQVGEQLAAPVTAGAKAIKKALTEQERLAERAKQAAQEVVSGLQKEVDAFGLTPDQKQALEIRYKIAQLTADGFVAEAIAARRLFEELLNLQSLQLADTKVDADPSGFKAFTDPKFQSATDAYFSDLLDRLDEAERAFNDVADAAGEIYFGFKNRDWVAAFSGLLRGLQQVKAAFASTATAGDKVNAASAVGQAAGSAIGGKVGGAVSGAASGASLGFALGGPVGAGIGAVVGGIAGFFGASKAKKRAKREAEEQRRQQEAERVAQVAAANRELEIRLIELGGDAVKAEAERRKDYLATLDPTTKALQEQVFAAEDLATATALLADFQHELAVASDAAATAEADRLKIVAQLPEALRPVANAVNAVIVAQAGLADLQAANAEKISAAEDAVAQAGDDLTDAFDRQADALQGSADRMSQIADNLRGVQDELTAQASAGTAGGFAAARSRLQGLAGQTDEASLSALPDAIRDFVGAARSRAGSKAELDRSLLFARQTAAAGGEAARGQLTSLQAQIQALEVQRQSFAGILGVKTAVESVEAAIGRFADAIVARADEQRAALEAVTAAQATISALVAAAQTANDNAAAVTTPTTATNTLATDVAAALADSEVFRSLVINTGVTARGFDDALQGGNALRVVDAA